MIVAKIDVTKIDKTALFKGSKGTYLDIILFENKEGEDQYGNTHMVVQSLPKERKDAGERGEILGNAKTLDFGKGGKKKAPAPPADDDDDDDSDFPF